MHNLSRRVEAAEHGVRRYATSGQGDWGATKYPPGPTRGALEMRSWVHRRSTSDRPGGMTSALRDELAARPGTLVLLVGEGAETLADEIARDWQAAVVSVGSIAASSFETGTVPAVASLVGDASVLEDLDVLFWRPELRVDVLAVLRAAARRHPVAAVWPGTIKGSRVRYSAPGRRDFYEGALETEIVLRTERDWYPGEMTFKRER